MNKKIEASKFEKALNALNNGFVVNHFNQTPMTIDFEDYLMEEHAEQYFGTDDDMPDDYADWVANLDVQELIDFGQEYAEKIHKHLTK